MNENKLIVLDKKNQAEYLKVDDMYVYADNKVTPVFISYYAKANDKRSGNSFLSFASYNGHLSLQYFGHIVTDIWLF